MRRGLGAVAIAVGAVAFAAGAFAVSGESRRMSLPATSPPRPLVAVVVTKYGPQLARVDDETLALRASPRLRLDNFGIGGSFSRDGSRLVVDDGHGLLTFVDTRRLRKLGVVDFAMDAGPVTTAWIGNRVVGLSLRAGGTRVRLVDPARRRILATKTLAGRSFANACASGAFVLLLEPLAGIGPVMLAAVDTRGGVRTVVLERIRAGWDAGDGEQPPDLLPHAHPGLAVDPRGRAFVVGAGAPVAEVDLRTLAVTYHDLDEPVSLLGRLHDWLEPRAEAKGAPVGPDRHARWLGEGILAVFGSDDHGWVDGAGRPQLRVTPAGLKLIDTRSWTVETLDPRATWATVAGGTLLATGNLWDSTTQEAAGTGLVAYGSDRTKRFHLFADQRVSVQAAGPRVLASATRRQFVIDVGSGRIVRTARGQPPQLLVRDDGC